MCVLTENEIRRRGNEIFRGKSWARECIQETSYDLRVDTEPVLRIGGKLYENGIRYKGSHMRIEPGEMALLPTMESFNMPGDLVGDIKIKFSHSRKGLTPLFGPKVDPYFGRGHPDERLYLWVSNLGLSPITLRRGERVFTVQFHKLYGGSPTFQKKRSIGPMVAQEAYSMGTEQSLGFVDRIEKNIDGRLGEQLTRVEQRTDSVVLFGVFLVASALLAGAATVLFTSIPRLSMDSGGTVIEALKGSLFMNLMYWVCIVLAIAVSVLGIAIVLQVLKPFFKWLADGFKALLRLPIDLILRLRWWWKVGRKINR